MKRMLLLLPLMLLLAGVSLAQMPTGTIGGKVSDGTGPLPGVTVTATSPSLQGTRTAITELTGDYLFRLLPPGDYTVVFTLEGFQTVEARVKVSAAQTHTVDATMPLSRVAEEITVVGRQETVSTAATTAVTYEQEFVEQLPVLRNFANAVLLAPGTNANAPRGGISMAGARSNENLFLINGVVVNENIRGQAFDLYIEDAIEETTSALSNISAEYGRFSGGVVNMLTKSGGNSFHGSFRTNFTNEEWNGKTPLTTSQVDQVNEVYEATLGGFLLRDRLWFFTAARDFEQDQARQFYDLSSYTLGQEEQRYEGKLTFTPASDHRIVGSYMRVDSTQTNVAFSPAVDASALDPSRDLPQELFALNYGGALSDNFLLEGQYSKRSMEFVDSGSTAAPGDFIHGTTIEFWPSGWVGASAPFCGSCDAEERSNENWLLKGSYFLTTGKLGSHDIVFGYDHYNDQRKGNNYQTSSNFRMFVYESDPTFGPNGDFYPMINGYVELDYWPIFVLSRGTNFKTDSLFVNDTWRVSDSFTVNLGLRYDKNDGNDASGATVSDDSAFSPRFGFTWSLGDGSWLVHGGYGRYVAALTNGIADAGGGGRTSWFGYEYGGPAINADCDDEGHCTFVPQYNAYEALAIVWNWFQSVGGVGNTDLWYDTPRVSGVNLKVKDLRSPYADEYSLGVTRRLGTRGALRADYVHREYGDFYANKYDTTTGTVDAVVDLAPGVTVTDTYDMGWVVNENDLLERTYDGLLTQFNYRFGDALTVGGNWTWSRTRGNFEGENANAGPIASSILDHPEYLDPAWYAPKGDLSTDQRHRVRMYAVWNAISTAHHSLSGSLMQNYATGTPYGAASSNVIVSPYVTNPGYTDVPTRNTYWFTDRDAFRTDDVTSTDISLNYAFKFNLGGMDAEMFLQPEIINVFNEHAVVTPDASVRYLRRFDPFNDTPQECPQGQASCTGYHWQKGANFGKAVRATDYQQSRTFRFSVGFRF